MNPELLARLRDIQGLDPISWWPLAAGWWLLILLGMSVFIGLVLLLRNLRKYPPGTWNRDAQQQLMQLKKRSANLSDSQLASELSTLLRRISITRMGRLQAAGLSGEQWLNWLHEKDPHGFNWQETGQVLLTLPYAPASDSTSHKPQLLTLLRAAIAWTEKR